MKKKLLMLLMASTLVFGITACGDKNEADTASNNDAASKNEASADKAEDKADAEDETAEDVEYDVDMLQDYLPTDNFTVEMEQQEGVSLIVGKSGSNMVMGYEVMGNTAILYSVDGVIYVDITIEGENLKQYVSGDTEEMGFADASESLSEVDQFESVELVESGADEDILKVVSEGDEFTFTVDKKMKKVVAIEGEANGQPVVMNINYDVEIVAPFDISEADETDQETVAMEMMAVLFSAMEE